MKEFNKILRNFRERRWEPAELDGGKLCEIVYSILRGHVDGSFPASRQSLRTCTTRVNVWNRRVARRAPFGSKSLEC